MKSIDFRKEFPIFQAHPELVYLDSAATAQRSVHVIEAYDDFIKTSYANVHRGVYSLSQKATDVFEGVRQKVTKFLGFGQTHEVIYTSGTTQSVNLVATAWERTFVTKRNIQSHLPQAIVVTRLEHHSNFVPWQQLALRMGLKFIILEINPETFELDLNQAQEVFRQYEVKILAVTALSNVLGIAPPLRELFSIARKQHDETLIFLDAAQGVVHNLDSELYSQADFVAFSAHKLGGPTGVGFLWGRESWLKRLSPYQYGGDMIGHVGDQDSSWNELPWKFEAGTPSIESVVASGAALDFFMTVDLEAIRQNESVFTEIIVNGLSSCEGVRVLSSKRQKPHGVISFICDKIHPHDLATFLDARHVAIRAGHHCAQPLLRCLNLSATNRVSYFLYNTKDDAQRLLEAFAEAQGYFSKRRFGGKA